MTTELDEEAERWWDALNANVHMAFARFAEAPVASDQTTPASLQLTYDYLGVPRYGLFVYPLVDGSEQVVELSWDYARDWARANGPSPGTRLPTLRVRGSTLQPSSSLLQSMPADASTQPAVRAPEPLPFPEVRGDTPPEECEVKVVSSTKATFWRTDDDGPLPRWAEQVRLELTSTFARDPLRPLELE